VTGRARRLEQALEGVAITLMTLLALVVIVAVVFRKAGASLVWYDEVAETLLAWLTYYAACLAALKHEHIGFPRATRGLPPRVRRGLYLIREAVIIAFFGVVAWAGWEVLVVLRGTALVSLPWMPAAVIQSVIPIGAVLFIVTELVAARERLVARP
jgi:TRAP-type C4-dicarboxylate transport system permease small subunit